VAETQIQISIVVPVYRAQDTLQLLVERISSTMEEVGIRYEIILVDDGSPDDSWHTIISLLPVHSYLRAIRLSRNFGQHSAITAGLERTRGQWTVVMDCDLQDLPEEIPNLYHRALEGFEIVLAKRTVRKDNLYRRLSSSLFYRVLKLVTGTTYDATVGNFGIYSHRVISAICSMPERVRYLPTMVRWVGFRSCAIEVRHASRHAGGSNYSLGKMLDMALDIMLANSEKPLRLAVKFGFAVALFGFLMTAWTVVNRLLGNLGGNPMGYASILSSIWMLAGCILLTLGTVGLYIGKIFEGVKHRPVYLVMEEL
jgi:polyisoprenyl-phosphate glycosyltransferase